MEQLSLRPILNISLLLTTYSPQNMPLRPYYPHWSSHSVHITLTDHSTPPISPPQIIPLRPYLPHRSSDSVHITPTDNPTNITPHSTVSMSAYILLSILTSIYVIFSLWTHPTHHRDFHSCRITKLPISQRHSHLIAFIHISSHYTLDTSPNVYYSHIIPHHPTSSNILLSHYITPHSFSSSSPHIVISLHHLYSPPPHAGTHRHLPITLPQGNTSVTAASSSSAWQHLCHLPLALPQGNTAGTCL